MEHDRSPDRQWVAAPWQHFTGEVLFGGSDEPTGPQGLVVLNVAFPPGARTNWHYHPGGQVLYVTAGAGIVRNADGETIHMGQGDAVTIPPGELHWHGAQPHSPMTHLSITTGGATQWEGGAVDDAEYDAGATG
jgi:quercetin dioxygenase-like cupin family protein